MLEIVSLAVAQVAASAFAGICLYIGFVQHPVRMMSEAADALSDFRAVIPRAEKVQAPLLVVGLLATALHLTLAFALAEAVGGLLMLAVLVLTLVSVLPINRRLLSGAVADHLGEAQRSLSRWGRLHTLRTALAAVGAISLWF